MKEILSKGCKKEDDTLTWELDQWISVHSACMLHVGIWNLSFLAKLFSCGINDESINGTGENNVCEDGEDSEKDEGAEDNEGEVVTLCSRFFISYMPKRMEGIPRSDGHVW